MCKEYINHQTGEKLDLEKVSHLKENALLRHRPDLWVEWNFEKNNELGLDIWEMTKSSGKKVNWICDLNHPFPSKVCHRKDGSNCPYCAGQKLLVGFNDMWTTNPELASLLANPEDGYKYMQSVKVKLDWKCHDCSEIIRDKMTYSIKNQGLKCPICNDKKHFPEKVVYTLLSELKQVFINDTTFEWSDNRRYDFYIPSLKVIIETHGEQHYRRTFDNIGGRSLEEEQANDKYKYEMAIQNGIIPENYIVIDSSKSDFDFIKDNILKSRLSDFLNLSGVDWNKIAKLTMETLLKKVSSLWNDGDSVNKISKKVNLNKNLISIYLRKASEIGFCDFKSIPVKRNVFQFSMNNELIKSWDSMVSAAESVGISSGGITSCCTFSQRSAGGYKWLYKEDYEALSKENIIPPTFKEKKKQGKPIVRISDDGDVVFYENITSSLVDLSSKRASHISSCCSGKRKKAYGFRWMYLEDYEELSKNQNKIS